MFALKSSLMQEKFLLTAMKKGRTPLRGAVLAELAVVLPLLLLLVFGLFEFGRYISHSFKSSNINYETTLTGAQSPYGAMGDYAMESRFNQLEDTYRFYHDPSSYTDDQGLEDKVYDPTEPRRTLSVYSLAEVNSLANYADLRLPLDFNIRYLAPLLLSVPDLEAGDLERFKNGDCTYDCDGEEHCPGPPPPTPCGVPIPPPPPPPCGCLAAETLISMADGNTKSIGSIKLGEKVAAFDLKSRRQATATVKEVFRAVRPEYLLINGRIKATAEHPFFVRHAWRRAADLKRGDILRSRTGRSVRIREISLVREPLEIVNVSVEPFKNYFAAGILVHNKNPCHLSDLIIQ